MIEGLTVGQTRALTGINVGASVLSFMGSFFVVLCFVAFKDLRKFSFKLVFYLSLSDMLCSLFNLLGNPGEGFLCYLQGYATQFFWVASFLWSSSIAFTLHRTVVRHKADVEQLEPIFHALVWGSAVVMTIVPSIGSDYGPAGAWCWVQNESETGKLLRFLCFYVPLWAAISFNGAIYIQVMRMLRNASTMAASMTKGSSDQSEKPAIAKVSMAMSRWGYYPLILIGSWTFGTINRIHNFVDPHHPVFALYVLQIATSALMGFFNSIAYGFNAAVRRTLRETIDKWFPNGVPLGNKKNSSNLEENELALIAVAEGPL